VARLHTRIRLHQADAGVSPRFVAGDRVRVKDVHPIGHTRLPRYVRGRPGVIDRYHGVHTFPDHERADDPISPPQPVYRVAFSLQELWGAAAEPGTLAIDIWESYLELA
jgi:nitrile hydratase